MRLTGSRKRKKTMSKYLQYGVFAAYYDRLMQSLVDYELWYSLLKDRLSENGLSEKGDVLDLACGTGEFANRFARDGYGAVGVDLSKEMLSFAREKAYSGNIGQPPLYVCQDMKALDLFGTVDAAVCCLDGLNYLKSYSELCAVFERVRLFLAPGAPFIFDLNTRYKFENTLACNSFVYELGSLFCVWENFYNKKSSVCPSRLTFFIEDESGAWIREEEFQRERAFDDSKVVSLLKKCGFESVEVYSSLSKDPISVGDERHYFICK